MAQRLETPLQKNFVRMSSAKTEGEVNKLSYGGAI